MVVWGEEGKRWGGWVRGWGKGLLGVGLAVAVVGFMGWRKLSWWASGGVSVGVVSLDIGVVRRGAVRGVGGGGWVHGLAYWCVTFLCSVGVGCSVMIYSCVWTGLLYSLVVLSPCGVLLCVLWFGVGGFSGWGFST